jgi:hypothetical protein
MDFIYSQAYISGMTQGKQKERDEDSRTSDVRLKPGGQVQLVPTKTASEPSEDKHIHPRRPLPLVPEKSSESEKEESED